MEGLTLMSHCYIYGGLVLMLIVFARILITIAMLGRTHNLPTAHTSYRDLEREDEYDERTRWN